MDNQSSRSENSIRNIKVSLLISVITTIAAFVNRTVFVHHLSTEYLGLNSLFSNILTYLSLTELGIGNAVTFALYKPIKERDNEKIRALMSEYQKLYTFVSGLILVLGLLITPFLQFFIKEDSKDIPLLRVYFLIYLLNLIMTLLFYCRRTIVICDQKEYLLSIVNGVFHLMAIAIQIAVLCFSRSYMGYLLVMLLFTIIEGIYVFHMTNKLYRDVFSIKTRRLSVEERGTLRDNIFATFLHKIGAVVVSSTDSIIISKFVGLFLGGLYSNYLLIIETIKKIILRIFASLSASVGNLMTEENKKHSEDVFYHILFLNCWICGFISICFICLVQPFISAWIGTKYLLDDTIIYVVSVSFYISMVRLPIIIFKEASGVFVQDKWKALIEGAVNLVLSLVLVQWFGISGVIAGTIISDVFVAMWYEAKVFFKSVYDKGFGKYILSQLKYLLLNTCLLLICLGLCKVISKYFSDERFILTVLVNFAVCIVVPNVGYILAFYRSKDFRYYFEILRKRTLFR